MRTNQHNGITMMKNLRLNSHILLVLAFILAQLCLPMQIVHAATTATKEAYAVLSTDKKTLTFYYDTNIYNYRMLGGALSIPSNEDEALPPNRWYLTLDSRVQPIQVRVRIVDTEATAISDPVRQQNLVNDYVNYDIYDMQGRKVAAGSEATDRLRKGLYIINNMKRMVK